MASSIHAGIPSSLWAHLPNIPFYFYIDIFSLENRTVLHSFCVSQEVLCKQ